MNTTVKNLEQSEVEITGELSVEELAPFRDKALKTIGEHAKIDGFRPGKIPENILVQHVGEMAILQEMARMAISEYYPKMLAEHSIDAIGMPNISITKIAPENPLEFKITTSVLPTIDLPDVEKIATKVMNAKSDIAVSDKELDLAIKDLQKMRAQYVANKDLPEGETGKSIGDIKDEDLEPIDDEYVKSLGAFENVDDFKKKLRENMEHEKAAKNRDKKRAEVIEEVLKKAKFDVPPVLVRYELDKMTGQMEQDLARAKVTMDDYLKNIKKTKEEMLEEWKPAATKRAQTQLLITKIAEEKKITPTEEAVEEETKKALEQFKQMHPNEDQSKLDMNHLKGYVVSMLTNQKVLEYFEGFGEEKK